MKLGRYVKKQDKQVQAIQLNLETTGFTYQKWGDQQTCKPGDWLVDNEGDIYTVDQQIFACTYRQVAPATYAKTTSVWAWRAESGGVVETKEGRTHYQAGDYIVSNNQDGSDAWAVKPDKFEDMHQQDD